MPPTLTPEWPGLHPDFLHMITWYILHSDLHTVWTIWRIGRDLYYQHIAER